MKDIRILLVEESRALRKMMAAYFAPFGWAVEDLTGFAEARVQAERARPDVVILDLDAAPAEALAFLADLARGSIETLVISESTRVEDRIACLEQGATDFMIKPVDLRELTLRLKRLWRARNRSTVPSEMEIACGTAVLDVAERVLRGASPRPVVLTPSEFRLLHLLLKNEARIVDRSVIARDVLGQKGAHLSRSVDVMVSKLRRKLALAGADRFIRNIRSEGYVLVGDERQGGRGVLMEPSGASITERTCVDQA